MIAAFLVPFFIMLIICADEGFYPFGDNQIAVIDMYHQYVPFLAELQYKLQTGGSFLYSWNGGAGTNFISLLAYYAASPLNLILAVFPQSLLMEGVTLIVLVKVSLGGLCMVIYLKGMYKREDCVTVAFATCYALCAYVVGYYWCLMWLDAVYLLPLCMLGLNRLLDKGDFKLYVITIALLLYTNYYIGGMVCIFILFYFPVLYFIKKRDLGVKGCLKKIGKVVMCSFTGILLSAFLLVPTFASLQNTYYIDSEMPTTISFYRSLLDIFNNLMPQMEVTTRSGAPNIYCGLFCVMMFAFFLLCKQIAVRKKIASCIMLAFLVLSFNVNILDYIWHGFHFPNQIPFRYSFVFSFLLAGIAYEAFLYIREITPKTIGTMAAIGTAYIVLVQKLYEEDMMVSFAYVSLLLLFLYSGFLALYRLDRYDKKLMKVLLLVIVIFEMVVNTSTAVNTVSHTSRIEYFTGYEDITKLVQETRQEDTDFYRMEISSSETLNAPMLYNYPGTSQFSSTVNASVTNFMVAIGLEGGGPKNRYNYIVTNPVTDAILGTRYLLSRGEALVNENTWELTGGSGDAAVYKNKYALSMGYMVEPAVLHTWDFEDGNPFDNLNEFVKISTGGEENVFTSIGMPEITGVGVTLGKYHNGYIDCSATGEVENAKVELDYTIQETQPIYVYIDTSYAESITAQRTDGTIAYLPTDAPAIVSLGTMQAGDSVHLTIEYESKDGASINAYVCGLDEKVWDAAYEKLADETMQVTDYSDTHVEGTINANEDGVCVLSVPYEKGWTLKVDGQEKAVSLLGDAFIAVPLEAGEHHIELTYLPDGLSAGIALTLAGIILFAAMCVWKRRKR